MLQVQGVVNEHDASVCLLDRPPAHLPNYWVDARRAYCFFFVTRAALFSLEGAAAGSRKDHPKDAGSFKVSQSLQSST